MGLPFEQARQVGGGCEPYKIQLNQVQSPAPGKEEHPATGRAGSSSDVNDLGIVGRWKAEREPAECPGSQEGQQHPGLYEQKHSQ